MNKQQQIQVKKYIDILVRYRVLVIVSIFLSMTVGLYKYTITPKIYKASSFLIYQKQKVNPAQMAPDLRDGTREIVSTLMQQVTSRTSLEKIIKDFDLYQELTEKLPLEDVIEVMRKNIYINPTKGDIFEVSFEGGDPKKVLLVTNALSSKFIEENLKYREEKATETSEYLGDELAQAKKNIDRKEEAMRDYKMKFYNEMPEQRQANVSRMNILQVKLQGVQDNIQQLEQTKSMLQAQLASQEKMLADSGSLMGGFGSDDPLDLGIDESGGQSISERQLKLEEYLKDLLIRYKEGHPEVKRVRRLISVLEKEAAVKAEEAAAETGEQAEEPLPSLEDDLGGFEVTSIQDQFKLQLENIDRTLAGLREEAEQHKLRIAVFEQWIEATPVREAEWSSLTRDYDELKKHYDYLVAQNLQAVSVENLERKQKGSQFKIMDAARLPEKPMKPDFKKIMLLAVGLGLGMGGVLAVGLDLFDTSIRDADELEAFLDVPVSCTVSFLYTDAALKKKKFVSVVSYAGLLLGAGLIVGVIGYLWRKGMLIV